MSKLDGKKETLTCQIIEERRVTPSKQLVTEVL